MGDQSTDKRFCRMLIECPHCRHRESVRRMAWILAVKEIFIILWTSLSPTASSLPFFPDKQGEQKGGKGYNACRDKGMPEPRKHHVGPGLRNDLEGDIVGE
jgi:hypothetical protein